MSISRESHIVWEEPIEHLAYVREITLTTRSRNRPPKECPGRRVGYAVLSKDAPSVSPYMFDRRMFWLAPHDRDSEPEGVYRTGVPCEAVDPRKVAAGVESKWGEEGVPW